jgi:hypothetical protein
VTRLAGLLVAALLLLAGCGGDDRLSKEEYQGEVQGVGKTLGDALGGIDTSSAGGLDEVGGQVTGLQTALREAADDLDDLSPPADVEDAHEKLVDGIRGFADDLEQLAEAAESGDLTAIQTFQDVFTTSDSVRKIREAADELQDKGYALE